MRIYSIFRSIDGEVNKWGQGMMCTFIRFAGCNLNCAWCDTKYARDPKSGRDQSITSIMQDVKRLGCGKITITGGEPYEQLTELEELVNELYRDDYGVSIETNGTHRPMWRSSNPSHVVDYKLPSSGMSDRMKDENFHELGPYDFVKFVIRDRKDFANATHTKATLTYQGCMARFAFSPVEGELTPQLLLEWMDKEELCDSILNVQLHKMLGLVEDR